MLMLVTKKYGIPSAKYSVGTHTNGDIFLILFTRARLLEVMAVVRYFRVVLDELNSLIG